MKDEGCRVFRLRVESGELETLVLNFLCVFLRPAQNPSAPVPTPRGPSACPACPDTSGTASGRPPRFQIGGGGFASLRLCGFSPRSKSSAALCLSRPPRGALLRFQIGGGGFANLCAFAFLSPRKKILCGPPRPLRFQIWVWALRLLCASAPLRFFARTKTPCNCYL